ncbi:hypothetical protein FS749_011896 [Ceratobasidium sp. UAMH 11750]|nr:hypothetical protein FS749_011896 [Ceratobasidium sp. UAMH 11750]
MQLLDEMAEQFPNRHVALILSLGTGQKNVIRLRPAGGIPKLQLIGMPKMLQKIATDCEETHTRLEDRFRNRPNVYFRFNVEQGMQGIGLEEWKRLGEVQSHTLGYTGRSPANQNIDSAVSAMIARHSAMTVQQAAGR